MRYNWKFPIIVICVVLISISWYDLYGAGA